MVFRHSSTMFLPLYLIVRPVSTEGSRGSRESNFCEILFYVNHLYTNVKPLFKIVTTVFSITFLKSVNPLLFFFKFDPSQ